MTLAAPILRMHETPSNLAQFTAGELIVPQLRAVGTSAAISELCSALAKANRVSNAAAFHEAVMRREQICGSATPDGWALPHARVQGLERLSFAVGRSATGLDWLEQRRHRVCTVFLFAVPEAETNTYLSLISGFARLSRDPSARDALARASDAEGILDVLRRVPLWEPRPAAAGS